MCTLKKIKFKSLLFFYNNKENSYTLTKSSKNLSIYPLIKNQEIKNICIKKGEIKSNFIYKGHTYYILEFLLSILALNI